MFVAAVAVLGGLLMISLVPLAHIQVKVVKSGSMEPTIKTGGIVIDMPASSYEIGDIITFGQDTKTQIPTTHRIVAVEGTGADRVFTTKGDANDAPDPTPTPIGEVHGKVLLTIPFVGYVLDFARKPLGFMLLVGVPAAFIILEELGKIARELMRMRSSRFTRSEAERKPSPSHAAQPIYNSKQSARPRVD